MNGSPHDTIERARVREVAAIFHSQEKLEAAVEDLLLGGFDRSDMDRLADLNEVRRRLGPTYVAPEELADIGQSPRQPVIMREDIAVTLALAAGVTAAVAGIFTAFLVVAVFDGGTVVAVIAALLAACVAGGIAALVTHRILKPPLSQALEPLMASHGVVLWVRIRSPNREETATRILQQHGGQAIRVHEIELEKHAEEIPLSSLRPDPWLGNEPLGRP